MLGSPKAAKGTSAVPGRVTVPSLMTCTRTGAGAGVPPMDSTVVAATWMKPAAGSVMSLAVVAPAATFTTGATPSPRR
jgi:hypothetical protein